MSLLRPKTVVSAHCDLPCGVYDPAQARIEAESVKAIMEKYQANEDPVFRTRALIIKEERAELVKHHLWVLWTDYFKPTALEKYPTLHDLFWQATKAGGGSGRQGGSRPGQGPEAARPHRPDCRDLLGDQEGRLSLAACRPAATRPAGSRNGCPKGRMVSTMPCEHRGSRRFP